MRLSELLSCAHFSIAAGRAPSIESLDVETNNLTCDWVEPSADPAIAEPSSQLLDDETVGPHEDRRVKAAVLQFWDLFAKTEDGTVQKGEYAGFVKRLVRVLLPGLDAEQEQRLTENSWDEDAGNATGLTFAPFFNAMVRFARMWTDSPVPSDLADFLNDLLLRTTHTQITIAETGEEKRAGQSFLVRFYSEEGTLDSTIPDSDFGIDVILCCKGALPTFKLEPKFESNRSFASMGLHTCWFEERVRDPLEAAAPSDGISRAWAPLDSVLPVGRAALMALRHAQADGAGRVIDVDTSAMVPAPDTILEAVRSVICGAAPNEGSVAVAVPLATEGAFLVEGSRREFGVRDLLSVGLRQPSGSNVVVVRPARKSVLYKLSAVRRGLELSQPSAVQAALPAALVDKNEMLRLPTFTDVLKGEVAVDAASGLVKPVRSESLLASSGLSTLAEALVVSAHNAVALPGVSGVTDSEALDSLRATGKKVPRGPAHAPLAAFTAHVPAPAEELHAEAADLPRLAATSPLALWILGQCDAASEYKREVCRRVARAMGLEWLQPAHLLELSVKTAAARRTPLMARCVEQLQRGLMVGVGDSLRLTLEMMSSARCKTNGYVFDFPSVGPCDAQAVADFVDRVRDLSGASEVRWEDFLRDEVRLPPRVPDPEAPKPPPAEEERGEDAEAEAPTEPAGGGAEGAPAGGTGAEAAQGEAAAGAEAEGAAGEEEAGAERAPPGPLAPNPLANSMPRRVVVLSMQDDELAAWRLTQLKLRHEERERHRKAMEAAGEEVEEEEEEAEPEELPPLEEELFDKAAGDILCTMAPYVPLPPLEPSQRLAPLPDQSNDIHPEHHDKAHALAGEAAAVKTLQERHQVPMLALHADGRPPEAMSELLDAVTGHFCAPRVPLPVPVQGGGDVEPRDLLRLELEERQASRRWSPWRQHCPVSLYERALAPGQGEFAVEYAGCVLLFADEAKQRRFCTWPKLFLSERPRIDLPGMHLGFALLSPAGYWCPELADRLRRLYNIDVVDVASLVHGAMLAPPLDGEDQAADRAEGEETGGAGRPTSREAGPRLQLAEKQAVLRGEALAADAAVRLVAGALGVERNLELIRRHGEDLAAAEALLAEAQAEEREPPAHLVLDEETGRPVVALAEPLRTPARGFLLLGFPESAEQLEALREQAGLQLEQVLILAPAGEDSPEPAEVLALRGVGEAARLRPALEAQSASLEELAGVEGLRVEQVPLEADLHRQLIKIQKVMDPFYQVVDGPSSSMEIPDPDAWSPEDEAGADEGEAAEPPQRPTIPWGVCGPYCPVTLRDDFWLFPGQKDFQHVFENKVYALASEEASASFVAEPAKYVPFEREPALPPPRILVTGPTGSGISRQCELLAQLYHVPVLDLEREWLGRVSARLEAARAARRAAEQEELARQAMLGEEGGPSWPPRWIPEERQEGEEGGDDAEQPDEAEAEEDGLEDDEARASLYLNAMRDVLGQHRGACIIDGSFFSDLANEKLSDEMRAARSLQKLLVGSRRIPDLTIILRCKNEFAARNCLDFDEIDREYQEKKDAYDKLCAEAEAEERDPPELPEGLHEDDEVKESDRRRAAFVENKKAEQKLLTELAEELLAARAPLQRVSVDRGEEPAHKAARWHCRPVLEHRPGLLLRHQALPASPTAAADLLGRALARPSRLGAASPCALDAPLFSGRPDALACAVGLRGRLYYPRGPAERTALLERPQDCLHAPAPSRVAVQPAVSVCGPPLSGKTALARRLAERTGAVYLAVPEVLSGLCDRAALPCRLSRELARCMRRGRRVPDAAVVEALRHRLSAADVLSRGWVLDDFPLTEEQARMLTKVGIVPHRLLVINVPEGLVFARAREIEKLGGEGDSDLVQHEQALQRQRLDAYMYSSPSVRSYYALTFDNVRDVEAGRSTWATFDHAVNEASASISDRLQYYRRTNQGMAAKVSGMCFTPARIAKSESLWRRYCPVSLTLNNELVPCRDARCMVEYRANIYWLSCPAKMRLFTEDPEAFLQVPLPTSVPHLLPAIDRRAPPPCQLEDYCPVALVDRRELVKASGHHIAQFEQRHYSLENLEARRRFLRRPERYARRAELPSKRPAARAESAVSLLSALSRGRDGRGVEPADMLTYMQASVAEVVCQGLVEGGGRRPLLPGGSARESALRFLARFLKAKNPLATAMHAARLRGQLEDFLQDCALPQRLRDLSGRREEAEAWTASDTQRFQELCRHFDEVFKR